MWEMNVIRTFTTFSCLTKYLKVYSGIYSLYMRMFIAVFVMLSYLNSDTAVKHLLRL